MSIVRLGDLQRAYGAQQRSKRRHDLRHFLLDGGAASAAAYQLASRRLSADGFIDNLGLADQWIARADETERAALFSDIATALVRS